MNKKRITLGIIILLFFTSLLSAGYVLDKLKPSIANENNIEGVDSSTGIDGSADDIIVPEEKEEESPANIEITIAAAGDIMFHSSQIQGAYNPEIKEYDFNYSFEHVKKYLESADLAIGNFETVTAGEGYKYQGLSYI